MLYREPKLLKALPQAVLTPSPRVSVLYREPKLLKENALSDALALFRVSVLYREPKLLKSISHTAFVARVGFSALP